MSQYQPGGGHAAPFLQLNQSTQGFGHFSFKALFLIYTPTLKAFSEIHPDTLSWTVNTAGRSLNTYLQRISIITARYDTGEIFSKLQVSAYVKM